METNQEVNVAEPTAVVADDPLIFNNNIVPPKEAEPTPEPTPETPAADPKAEAPKHDASKGWDKELQALQRQNAQMREEFKATLSGITESITAKVAEIAAAAKATASEPAKPAEEPIKFDDLGLTDDELESVSHPQMKKLVDRIAKALSGNHKPVDAEALIAKAKAEAVKEFEARLAQQEQRRQLETQTAQEAERNFLNSQYPNDESYKELRDAGIKGEDFLKAYQAEFSELAQLGAAATEAAAAKAGQKAMAIARERLLLAAKANGNGQAAANNVIPPKPTPKPTAGTRIVKPGASAAGDVQGQGRNKPLPPCVIPDD